MNLGAVFFVGNLTCSLYATHLAHPVLCRPTHFNIAGYASEINTRQPDMADQITSQFGGLLSYVMFTH